MASGRRLKAVEDLMASFELVGPRATVEEVQLVRQDYQRTEEMAQLGMQQKPDQV